MLGVLLQPPPLELSPPTLPAASAMHIDTHISRFEAWESSSRGGEVVALALGVLQETLGHLCTDRVTSMIPVVLPAVPISEPASERIKGARLQLASQYVLLVHGQV